MRLVGWDLPNLGKWRRAFSDFRIGFVKESKNQRIKSVLKWCLGYGIKVLSEIVASLAQALVAEIDFYGDVHSAAYEVLGASGHCRLSGSKAVACRVPVIALIL